MGCGGTINNFMRKSGAALARHGLDYQVIIHVDQALSTHCRTRFQDSPRAKLRAIMSQSPVVDYLL